MNALTGNRKANMLEMFENTNGKTRLRFEMPSRGLLGFGPEVSTMTKGSAVVNHTFLENRIHAGLLGADLDKGKLVSSERGKSTAFSLESIAERGVLFINPGDAVYPGMVIGENSRDNDMDVNPTKAKAKTNMRTQGKEERTSLPPPKIMSVEEVSERALRKTRILAMNPAKWLQRATSTTKLTLFLGAAYWLHGGGREDRVHPLEHKIEEERARPGCKRTSGANKKEAEESEQPKSKESCVKFYGLKTFFYFLSFCICVFTPSYACFCPWLYARKNSRRGEANNPMILPHSHSRH